MPKIKKNTEKDLAEVRAKFTKPNGPAAFDDPSDEESTAELKADWEALKGLAKKYFTGTDIPADSLHPKQRLVAFAIAMTWPLNKIARASGVARSTLQGWAKRPDVQGFVEDIQYRSGQKDPKDYLTTLQFKALKAVEELMEGRGTTDSTRMSAAKFIWEAKNGKAKESIEHSGDMLREIYARLDKKEADDHILPHPEAGEADSGTDSDEEEHGWVN